MMTMNKNKIKMKSQRDYQDHQLKRVSKKCKLNSCSKSRKMNKNKNKCTKSKSHRRRSKSKDTCRISSSALIITKRSFL